ncbi:three component ABC system middle component [Micromonospora sp. S-DT3-3-22]|uniref:three component ABC system middle component n=1 Tax=Micromonospora sp. S-DT3-3-22 TaxID=2755359 RepID=UPI001E4987FE|nr:three component ABC system middle component [Micromonospora sp. S-DT3-3-22]
MTPWEERSQIEAAYLNPALVAAVIATASDGFQEEAKESLPWPVSFLVVPLILHSPTRRALPKDTRTHISTWLGRNPVLHAGFPARAQSLVPVVREGLRFGLRNRMLSLSDESVAARYPVKITKDSSPVLRPARLAGRWFAKTKHSPTLFALFGVEP